MAADAEFVVIRGTQSINATWMVDGKIFKSFIS